MVGRCSRIGFGGGSGRGGFISGFSALAQMERGGEGLAAYKGGKRSLAHVLRSYSGAVALVGCGGRCGSVTATGGEYRGAATSSQAGRTAMGRVGAG